LTQRNYAQFVQRLDALPSIDLSTIGLIGEYPVHCISLKNSREKTCKILLTAGVHGDEPAGVEAVLHLLENERSELLEQFSFAIVPCINPSGYVHNTRENGQGADINRSFEEDHVNEVHLIKDLLQGQQIDCFVDLHEDWEATGFYLYEGRRNKQWIGPDIISTVETIGHIDPDGDSDDDEADAPLSRGVRFVAAHLAALKNVLAHYS
jgi:protein MpaA